MGSRVELGEIWACWSSGRTQVLIYLIRRRERIIHPLRLPLIILIPNLVLLLHLLPIMRFLRLRMMLRQSLARLGCGRIEVTFAGDDGVGLAERVMLLAWVGRVGRWGDYEWEWRVEGGPPGEEGHVVE